MIIGDDLKSKVKIFDYKNDEFYKEAKDDLLKSSKLYDQYDESDYPTDRLYLKFN